MFGFPRQEVVSPDILLTPQYQDVFAAQAQQVRDTCEAHGLSDRNAALLGTAGLAMHGIYAHVALAEGSSFDVDAFLNNQTFVDLQKTPGADARPASNPTEVHLPAQDGTLKVDGLRTPLKGDFARSFGCSSFDDLAARTTEIDDLLVLSPTLIAKAKEDRGELKDLAGIVQGHVVAWSEGHSIVKNEVWQWKVIGARNVLMRRGHNRAVRRALPGWLGGLVASGFDHPAFTSLHPSMATVGLAS